MLSSHNRSLALQLEDPCAGFSAQELRAHARAVHERLRSLKAPPIRPSALPVAVPDLVAVPEAIQPALIVRGAQNADALAALEMLAARKFVGPLYIWGGGGLGKTTIVQAAGAICPAARVIDNADRWHELTLAALSDGGPLVLTGPLPPAQLEHGGLGKALTHALVVELRQFDRDFARELASNMIAAQRLRTPELEVPQTVLDAVLDVPDLDGHVLAGLFKGLAFAAARGQELTQAAVERVRGDLIFPSARDPRVTIRLIQRVVAEHFGIEAFLLCSHRRQKSISEPRQMAMTLCKRMTPRSMPEIGRMFQRDHTTILHAVSKFNALEAESPDTRRLLDLLTDKVRRQAYVEAEARNANQDA
ncbi:helix-turn-helix domain-containing protein [Xanthobacter sp. DSM 14520]|uniref:helix-turn-helix domain-containing protein n=1 Tax=Xanthobacter autotrophicus (strain ATCC BAA-1158 / Py2) TaxID=78245 RepID=UPI003729705F